MNIELIRKGSLFAVRDVYVQVEVRWLKSVKWAFLGEWVATTTLFPARKLQSPTRNLLIYLSCPIVVSFAVFLLLSGLEKFEVAESRSSTKIRKNMWIFMRFLNLADFSDWTFSRFQFSFLNFFLSLFYFSLHF